MVNVRRADRDQVFLLPPSVRDWLPEDHLAWFVIDVVDELDLSAFYGSYRADGRGGAVYDPAVMLAVLLYAYCTGERSSRRIERRLVEDVAYRVLAANQTIVPTSSLASATAPASRSAALVASMASRRSVSLTMALTWRSVRCAMRKRSNACSRARTHCACAASPSGGCSAPRLIDREGDSSQKSGDTMGGEAPTEHGPLAAQA